MVIMTITSTNDARSILYPFPLPDLLCTRLLSPYVWQSSPTYPVPTLCLPVCCCWCRGGVATMCPSERKEIERERDREMERKRKQLWILWLSLGCHSKKTKKHIDTMLLLSVSLEKDRQTPHLFNYILYILYKCLINLFCYYMFYCN